MIDFEFIADAFPQIMMAIPVTLLMALLGAVFGWIIGLLIALIRKNRIPVLSQIAAVFVSFMRGVPLVILLYLAYFAVPIMLNNYFNEINSSIDISKVPAIVYAIVALTLDQAAYSSEIFRSSIESVDEGQMEAARSVGMTSFQALRRIIFPQALAVAIPNLGGLFVGLIKGTSLAYLVGVNEIMATANLLSQPKYAFIEAYIMTTVIYELISFICNKLFNRAEKHFNVFRASAIT
jgi:L-cystine transport system permease protein